MNVHTVAEKLSLRVLAGEAGLSRTVSGCYIGDLLSWVMSRAQEGDVWVTVMGNINAIAVTKLTDAACILLCENAPLDKDALEQANLNNIPVLMSEKNAYTLAGELRDLLKGA